MKCTVLPAAPLSLRLHPGQPNWQLVRFKDYELRLALPALLNDPGPHALLAVYVADVCVVATCNIYTFAICLPIGQLGVATTGFG